MPKGSENRISIEIRGEFDDKELKRAKREIALLGKKIKEMGKKFEVSTGTISTNFKKTGDTVKKTTAEMRHGFSATMGKLESLGNRFRYLSLAVGIMSAGMVLAMKDFVNSAREGEEAMLRLHVTSMAWGQNTDEAIRVAQKLARTGLMPMAKAASAVSFLMARGLSIEQTEKALWSLLNRAVIFRELQYDIGEAVVKTAEGILYNRERLADATLIQNLFNQGIEEASKRLGKKRTQLTELEKVEGIYNVIMREGVATMGLAEKASLTLGGQFGKLNQSIWELKKSLGDALRPIVGNFTNLISSLAEKIKGLSDNHKDLTGTILAVTTALTALLAGFATFGAILPMISTGVKGFIPLVSGLAKAFAGLLGSIGAVNAGLRMYSIYARIASLSTLKFTLISLGLTALIAGIGYAILRATGRWDAFKESIKDVTSGLKMEEEALEALKKRMTEVDEPAGAEESRRRTRIAYQRRIEDLEEALNQEISKGLWADQTKIRNLRKRLKREKEDLAEFEKDKEEMEEKSLTPLEKALKRRKELFEEQIRIMEEYKGTIKTTDYLLDALLDPKTWETYFTKIKEIGSKIKEALAKIFSWETWAGIIVILINGAGTLWGKLSELTNTITSLWVGIGKAAAKGFLNAFGIEVDRVKEPFKRLAEWIRDTWARIVAGINRGILWKLGLPGINEPGLLPWEAPGVRERTMAANRVTIPSAIESAMSTAPIININNPVVRREQDIWDIANAVKEVLGQEQKWNKLGGRP